MRRLVIVPALALASVFLVGCGPDTEGQAVQEQGRSTLEGGFEYGKVALPDGRVLECVTMKRSTGQSSWGGLSCNWNESERMVP